MNKEYLILQLNNIKNAKRENRLCVANLVIENPILFKYLLELVVEFNNKLSIKAAWVLEFVCTKKLDWLAPHLNYFTKNIHKIKFDSAVRPVAKICEFLAKSHTSTQASIIKNKITKNHINNIIEAGFDWLIGKQKVAVKAYTMEMLYLFGKNEKWIHQELQLIIQQNIINESAAYKARGKKILSWIKNK
ncbi:MAG: adenylosuccinate lyase [Lutibacter sp.]|uniref:adenylosuccinate lyase n=1 Tax=Lutibacter sp. TaxID=1925666 RepID=UPI00385AF5FA